MNYSGVIIFWNKEYGFIEYNEPRETIFFHITNIHKKYREISLLDKVSFIYGITMNGIHIGKPCATNVALVSKGNISEYKRTIGLLVNWNGVKGYLRSPQLLPKTVLFYYSRFLNTNRVISNHEFLVFHTVKSSNNPDQLFALFAYPIDQEKDIDFLRSQQNQNDIPEIDQIISNLIQNQTVLSVEQRFILELANIKSQQSKNFYINVESLIGRYKNQYNYIPSYALLKEHIEEIYLIQLWENNIIKSYDLDLMKRYFYSSSSETKRLNIGRFPQNHKLEILHNYFNLLKENKKFSYLNNDVKTLLDIIHRNKDSNEVDIYRIVRDLIIHTFSPEDIIELWINDYIDNISEAFITSHFDINYYSTKILFNKEFNIKHKEIIGKICINYIVEYIRSSNFDLDYYKFIKYLLIFQDTDPDAFILKIKEYLSLFNSDQKLIIWLFDVRININHFEYFKNSIGKLNIYFLIRYLINNEIDVEDAYYQDIANQINENDIIDFALNFSWNELIYPVLNDSLEIYRNGQINNRIEKSFLYDIRNYIDKYKRIDININNIGKAIYENLPKYQLVHLQLWLQNYVELSEFNYLGYYSNYKYLELSEQKEFRIKGNFNIRDEIQMGEMEEVSPCKNFITVDINTNIYNALPENIYFSDGGLKLRREDKSYTDLFVKPLLSSGFNRIPKLNYYNTFEFKLTVIGRSIISPIIGIEEFITQIQTGEIERALGKIISPDTSDKHKNLSYLEDLKLRKLVIDYLNKNQTENITPKIIGEPKNRYRRLDENVDFQIENTQLFTVSTDDGYGIIWENIDFDEDRATFIFKTKNEFYKTQLEKIGNSIISFGQFRSTLVSKNRDPQLKIFKNNLGYISKILKERGKNESFANWKLKLKKALSKPIPDLPDFNEIQGLKNWQVEMPHNTPAIRKKVVKIKDKNIRTTDFDFKEQGQNSNDSSKHYKQETSGVEQKMVQAKPRINKQVAEIKKEKRKKLINKIEELNSKLRKILNR